MATRQSEKRSTLVFLGHFNPQIFHPAWFAAQDLIQKQEAEEADNVLTTPQLSRFQLNWVRVEVLLERFAAHGTPEPSSTNLLRDLVLGTFHLLRHTPITAMGINREAVFSMESEEAWHAMGHRLAPPEHLDGLLMSPGMRTLIMEGKRPDDFKGHLQVRVEPFQRSHPWGVRISVNDHYDFSEGGEPIVGCEEVMRILKDSMDASIERSNRIIDHFLEV